MPTIGDSEFPATNVDTAVEAGKKLASQFKGLPFDRTALAAALSYKSAKTGAFNQLLADLRKYGVITGRGETLQATEVVQRLAVPKDQTEYAGAVVELMNNVPLFRDLYDHYQGAVPTEDDLLATLINETKADRVKVTDVVGRIRANLASGWAKGWAYQPSTGPDQSPGSGRPGIGARRATVALPASISVPEGMICVVAGDLKIQYPFTPTGIALMKLNFTESFWTLLEGMAKAKEGSAPPATAAPSP